jgi:hypothetical protein
MNNTHLHIVGSQPFFDLLTELNFNYSISSDKNLSYNNKDLLVRIIFVEKLLLTEVKKFFLEDIPTIFLLKNKDFLKKNKLILLDFHVSLFLPVEVLSFREILNILTTKYNFFKKSKIVINDYEIDNQNNGLKKSFLLKNIWNRSSDLESHAFETHLHRLRKKIDKFFNDKKFILEKNSLYYLSR